MVRCAAHAMCSLWVFLTERLQATGCLAPRPLSSAFVRGIAVLCRDNERFFAERSRVHQVGGYLTEGTIR